MGWLDHDRLGFNYRLSDVACALGLAQLERLEELLAGRAGVAALYREALAGIEGLELPCPDARRCPSRLVRVRRAAPARGRSGRDRTRARRAGIPSKPYFPAVHLMSYYRERFGHREGEFPVCEDVAATVDRAAVLPRDDRGAGGAGRGGAGVGAGPGGRKGRSAVGEGGRPADGTPSSTVSSLKQPVSGATGQVRIEVLRCGICGSDLHARHGLDAWAELAARSGYDRFGRSDQSVVFGHEFCGEVVEHGPQLPAQRRRRARTWSRCRCSAGSGRGRHDRPVGACSGRVRRADAGRGGADDAGPERAGARRRGADRADGGRACTRSAAARSASARSRS